MMLKSFYRLHSPSTPQSGAQVGFLKMSAEGVGSRVTRAKHFGLTPSLLTTVLGSENVDSHEVRRAVFILSAINPQNCLPSKVFDDTFDVLNFRSMNSD